jgi:N-acetylmuramoyl-L-alanine amidase
MVRHVHILVAVLLLGAVAPHAPGAATTAGPAKVTWVGGKDFVLLSDLARAYTMTASGPVGKQITLRNRYHELLLSVDSREARLDGTAVWLHEPVQPAGGKWAIRAVDVRKMIDPVLNPERYLAQNGYRLVILDPGHGGEDTGARGGRGVEEKRVVLDVCRRVRAILANAGVRVYMTRDTDRFVELTERTRKAKFWGADVFVSVHLNSAGNAEAAGTETYALAAAGYYSTGGGQKEGNDPGGKNDAANAVLAYHLQKGLVAKVASTDRGVRRSRFLVLREATCPAALVECCFVSNKAEEEKLLTEEYRDKLAAGIARGILNYLNTVKKARLTGP